MNASHISTHTPEAESSTPNPAPVAAKATGSAKRKAPATVDKAPVNVVRQPAAKAATKDAAKAAKVRSGASAQPAAKADVKKPSKSKVKAPKVAKPAGKTAGKATDKATSGKGATVKSGSGKEASKKSTPKPPAALSERKVKMVRDSFTMPKDEYAAIGELKARGVKLGRPLRKSELLRAGILALKGLQDKALLAAITALPALKTGRPRKS